MEIIPKKIAVIFGTRSDTIKLAPVIQELKKHERFFTLCIITTEQNRGNLDDILSVFDIIPNYELNVAGLRQSLSILTQNILEKLDYIFAVELPEMVLVQGDSAATFASGIAAFHRKIPIVHVHADVRSSEKKEPIQEEAYRRLTSRIADLHCTSTASATKALIKEGTPKKDILCTGSTITEALEKTLRRHFDFSAGVPDGLLLKGKKFAVITKQTGEGWEEDLLKVCAALKKLSVMHPSINFVFPVFNNQGQHDPATDVLKGLQNVFLTKALPFPDFINLMALSYIVFTDSNGVQEAAEALCKPVLMLSDATARPGSVKSGSVKLIGTEAENIVKFGHSVLSSRIIHRKMTEASNRTGDGKASERIAALLLHFFGFSKKHPSAFRPASQ